MKITQNYNNSGKHFIKLEEVTSRDSWLDVRWDLFPALNMGGACWRTSCTLR